MSGQCSLSNPGAFSSFVLSISRIKCFWSSSTVRVDQPPPHTTGTDGQTSFPGHLPHLCHRDGVAQIPAHTPHDQVAWIVSPFERIGCSDGHVYPYQIGHPAFRNGTPITPIPNGDRPVFSDIYAPDYRLTIEAAASPSAAGRRVGAGAPGFP